MPNRIIKSACSDYMVTLEYRKSSTFFKDLIDAIGKGFFNGWIFRGHSSESYKLIPSFLRYDNVEKLINKYNQNLDCEINNYDKDMTLYENEFFKIQNFLRISDDIGIPIGGDNIFYNNGILSNFTSRSYFNPAIRREWFPENLFETIGLMQHYGLQTRFLDWSFDVFVALYFAYTEAFKKKESKFLTIWALNKDMCQSERHNSLIFIKPNYAKNNYLCAQKGLFTYYKTFTPSQTQIEKAKNNEAHLIDKRCLSKIIRPYYNSNTLLYKINISCGDSIEGIRYLARLKYKSARIFPDFNGVVKQIHNDSLFRDMIFET